MHQSALSSLSSPNSVSELRPTHTSSGRQAPRKQLANMIWQYSLGLHSFLVALGRMPGITLCVQDFQGKVPGTEKHKHLPESPSCWLPEFTHRELKDSDLPDRFQDMSQALSLERTLRAPEPKPIRNQMHKPLHYHRQVEKNWGQKPGLS